MPGSFHSPQMKAAENCEKGRALPSFLAFFYFLDSVRQKIRRYTRKGSLKITSSRIMRRHAFSRLKMLSRLNRNKYRAGLKKLLICMPLSKIVPN